MVSIIIIAVFVLGYTAIAFEHPLKVDKAASALITGVLCWTIYTLTTDSAEHASEELLEHLGEIASILFFLLGAMTIVQLIDTHNGFDLITQNIKTRSKKKLLLIITVLTFFLSALLDNLTTSIVMVSLTAKILKEREDRLWFAGLIIITANAGGAWSPLGDVTTTMLWIGGQITALSIVKGLIIPSLFVCVIPTLFIANKFTGKQIPGIPESICTPQERKEGKIILIAGVSLLIAVPVFKTVTHLPPFMGMLLALGLMWVITTVIHKGKEPELAERYKVSKALEKIDAPSILFFLGILLAVSALQSIGLLRVLSAFLKSTLHNDYLIGTLLGLLSAIVDNVPLVAASQGMYDMSAYPQNHPFWEFLALATGTGGSAIIIGSAAGVAVMGIEQVNFIWYLKKISLYALGGFFSGVIIFILQQYLMGR